MLKSEFEVFSISSGSQSHLWESYGKMTRGNESYGVRGRDLESSRKLEEVGSNSILDRCNRAIRLTI